MVGATDPTIVAIRVNSTTGRLLVDASVDTELPAAAAITDNFANPTTTNVMAMGMVYDGSAWDMARGDSTNGLLVNLGSNNDVTIDSSSIVKTEDAQHASGDKGIMMLGVENEDGAALTAGDKDYTPIAVTPEGNVIVKQEGTVAVSGTFWQTTQPVSIASAQVASGAISDGADVTQGTTTDARSTATDATSVTIMQVLKEISYMEQNPASRAVTGTFWQTTQPVSLASVPSHAVTNAGTFVVQENGDALTALQLIDNTVAVLGTATYLEGTTSGNVIGAVRNDTLAALADTDNEIAPLQVNASGALYIAMSGSLPDTATGDLAAITTAVELIDNAVDGNYLNVNMNIAGTDVVGGAGVLAAGVQRVTIATDDEVNNLLGTIDADTSNIVTAVELIDNSIYVDDADWTADTSSHTLVGGVTQATPTANTDGDVTPLITNSLRELRMAYPESDLALAATTHVKKYYTATTPTDGIIWSPAAGKRWYLTLLAINLTAASTVTVEDDLGAGDSVVYKAAFAANSGVVLPFPTPMFSGEDAADLIVTSTAGDIYVTAVGYEI